GSPCAHATLAASAAADTVPIVTIFMSVKGYLRGSHRLPAAARGPRCGFCGLTGLGHPVRPQLDLALAKPATLRHSTVSGGRIPSRATVRGRLYPRTGVPTPTLRGEYHVVARWFERQPGVFVY